jgi:hypothetical protein
MNADEAPLKVKGSDRYLEKIQTSSDDHTTILDTPFVT